MEISIHCAISPSITISDLSRIKMRYMCEMGIDNNKVLDFAKYLQRFEQTNKHILC